MKIGRVVQADIQKQYIRVHLKISPEDVFIGMPCIVEGERAKYYCIITNILQQRDDMTLSMSFSNIGFNEGISNTQSNLDRPDAMEVYTDLYCLRIIYNDGRRKSFKTIPRRLSETREATQNDIDQIYVKPLLDTAPSIDIDPEVGNEVKFDPHGFVFGSLASNQSIEIPIRMDKLVERPLEIVGMTGAGKAQPLDAKILTPSGWKSMGDLKIGDLVFSNDGKPYPITGIYPQGKKEIFKISFQDGSSTECSGDHLWNVKNKEKYITLSTSEIKSKGLRENRHNFKWQIPITSPIEFTKKNLPINPYLLGILLGKGKLVIKNELTSVFLPHESLISEIEKILPKSARLIPKKLSNDMFSLYFSEKDPLFDAIQNLYLQEDDAFIPNEYKFSNITDRFSLLQGLLDVNGKIGRNHIYYSTFSEKVLKDIKFLVQSLGGQVHVFKRKIYQKKRRILYVLNIVLKKDCPPPFKNKELIQQYSSDKDFDPIQIIVNIEKIAKKKCQCITIDSPSHLYLTDDCIVTHNTVTAKNIIFRIIGDINQCLHTRMIIFDVQNEYIIRKAGRKDLGIYDLYPDKVKIITLDPENCLQMGIHDAEMFKVFEENITIDDILSILSTTNLSEKMKRTLWHLHSEWIKQDRHSIGTFYDYLMRFYNEPIFAKSFDSEGTSYQALHSRLRTIARNGGVLSKFITQKSRVSDRDTIQDLIDQLKSSNQSKKSFIIHFGKFGKTSYVYEFIANILGRRVYNEYSEKNDINTEEGNPPYDSCIFFLEEAHKFIKKSESSSIFNLIAREMRKYGLTLFIVDQMPSKLDDEIVAQLNNRIIHRMSDVNDIKSSLAGLDVKKWSNMISNLEDGESLCFGSMVDYMPTIIKSFYGDPQEFKAFHGVQDLSRSIIVKKKKIIKVDQLSRLKKSSTKKSSTPFKKVKLPKSSIKKSNKRKISPPQIPNDDFDDDFFD